MTKPSQNNNAVQAKYECERCSHVFEQEFGELINPSCVQCGNEYVKWTNYQEYKEQPLWKGMGFEVYEY